MSLLYTSMRSKTVFVFLFGMTCDTDTRDAGRVWLVGMDICSSPHH